MFSDRLKLYAPLISSSTCLLLLAFYNFSFWRNLAAVAAWPLLISIAILLASVMFLFLTIASNKYTYKPILILFILIAAVSAYAMDHYGYVISTQAFQNLLESDAREVADLLNWKLCVTFTLLFIVPTLFISYVKIQYPSLKIILLHALLALILILLNLSFFSRNYASLLRNNRTVRYYINPGRPIYSMIKTSYLYLNSGVKHEFLELDPQPQRIAGTGKPKLIVLVVGESDRAVNHLLNGYHQNTNPLLSQRDDVYSFSKFYACGTETAVSVPCMFSAFPRQDFTRVKGLYTENVLDLLQKTQVQVLWRDNDSGCKHVCDRVTVHDFNTATIKPYCNAGECHDEVLLHKLQDYIDTKQGDQLIVLHKMGNHGPAYYKRYPSRFTTFTPICKTNELQDCSNQEIINTYDNIIVYTDYFLDRIIQQLEANQAKYQTALIYVSDHGQSLGEKGVYLHAMPYILAPKEQIHIPFIFWASKDFELDRDRLRQIQHQEFSHDHLFHTLLGLFKVQTAAYQPQLDMFAAQ